MSVFFAHAVSTPVTNVPVDSTPAVALSRVVSMILQLILFRTAESSLSSCAVSSTSLSSSCRVQTLSLRSAYAGMLSGGSLDPWCWLSCPLLDLMHLGERTVSMRPGSGTLPEVEHLGHLLVRYYHVLVLQLQSRAFQVHNRVVLCLCRCLAKSQVA